MGLIIGIIIVVIIGGAVVYALTKTGSETNENATNEAMTEDKNANTNDAMMEETNSNTNEVMEEDGMIENSNINGVMMEEKTTNTNEVMTDDENSNTNSEAAAGEYMPYSPAAFAEASGQKRVLFFYASWCPTCRPADANITANADQIPDGVVVFRTDYDTETELKSKYGVTYQHTFVQVDADDNLIKKWNGGDIDEIISNVI